MAQTYKHGEKVRRWTYKWDYVPNPNYNPHMKFSKDSDCWYFFDNRKDEFIRAQTDEKVYYGEPYRFRCDPLPGGGRWNKKGGWSKYDRNKGSGKCWKREWYKARDYAKEIYEEYGITFKNSDQIPYKHGHNGDRSWKRTKKKKQWM